MQVITFIKIKPFRFDTVKPLNLTLKYSFFFALNIDVMKHSNICKNFQKWILKIYITCGKLFL